MFSFSNERSKYYNIDKRITCVKVIIKLIKIFYQKIRTSYFVAENVYLTCCKGKLQAAFYLGGSNGDWRILGSLRTFQRRTAPGHC